MSDPVNLDFSGKVALITGASRGIGEATARLLASRGAHVIVSSRKTDAVAKVAGDIRDGGGKATGLACHVGDPESVEAVFGRIASEFGRLDILVNNAATNPHFGHIVDTPLEMVDKTIQVNIRGYFQMSQKAAIMMRETGGGAIVNTSSVNGDRPAPFQGIYSITKAAVISMTRAFAKRLDASLAIIDKRRPGPNKAEVMNFIGDVNGKEVVIFDDMIDTAGTITQAGQACIDAGAVSVLLGGDDSVPIPMLEAFEGRGPITILQIDAHIDWRDKRRGEPMGISSTMRRASADAAISSRVTIFDGGHVIDPPPALSWLAAQVRTSPRTTRESTSRQTTADRNTGSPVKIQCAPCVRPIASNGVSP